MVKAFGECLLPAKQPGQFQPHFPKTALVRGQMVGIWALLSQNSVLGARRVFLTPFHSSAPQQMHFFMMKPKSAWRTALGPLRGGIGTRQAHVVPSGAQFSTCQVCSSWGGV